MAETSESGQTCCQHPNNNGWKSKMEEWKWGEREVRETPVEVGEREREREERAFYWKVKLKWKKSEHGLPARIGEVSKAWAIRWNQWLRIELLHPVQYPRHCMGYESLQWQ